MFKLEKSTEFCHIRGHQFSDTTKQASRYASYSSIGEEFSRRELLVVWNEVFSIKVFLIFCEFMKFFFEFFFLIKTHKTPWPLGQGGNFYPTRNRGFGCSVTTEWT